jgi:hypothetical protein
MLLAICGANANAAVSDITKTPVAPQSYEFAYFGIGNRSSSRYNLAKARCRCRTEDTS